MADKIKELLEKNGQMIIDGSMSTALEQMGANLNCSLWTARALVDTPELVKKVHTDYFKAGADCGITCSYQATIPGLMENGFTHDEAAEIVANSVKLFLEAREEWWNAEGKAQGARVSSLSGRHRALRRISCGWFGIPWKLWRIR